jgi:hypothetical protein
MRSNWSVSELDDTRSDDGTCFDYAYPPGNGLLFVLSGKGGIFFGVQSIGEYGVDLDFFEAKGGELRRLLGSKRRSCSA